MMAASEESVYLSSVKWNDKSCDLINYVTETQLPQVGKIIKGQYLNIGAPTTFSSSSLNQIVFMTQAGKRVKVVAQCVRFKEGRTTNNNGMNSRVVPVGPKLAIPCNYEGWFEILSEEGRAVKCIESVADLIHIAKRSTQQQMNIVLRENHMKMYLAKTDDPNVMSDKVRILQAGETFNIVNMNSGVANTENNNSPNTSSCKTSLKLITHSNGTSKYIQCMTSKGEVVYMNVEQKGKFSLVAKENSISGVHTIKNLLTKRLPLMVRLVHGKCKTLGVKNFHNVMRLLYCYEEEYLLAMPLLKDNNNTPSAIEVPLSAPLKLLAPKNNQQLIALPEHNFLIEKCNKLMKEMSDQIVEFTANNKHDKDCNATLNGGEKYTNLTKDSNSHLHERKPRLESNFSVKRSLSDPQPQINANDNDNIELRRVASAEDSLRLINLNGNEEHENSWKEEEIKKEEEPYDEIDQIYDYVRGFAPLPDRIRNSIKYAKYDNSVSNDENRPEPPPLETMPLSLKNRRMSYPTAIKDITPTNLIFPHKRANRPYESNKLEQQKVVNIENTKMLYLPTVSIPMRPKCGKIYVSTPDYNNDAKVTPKLFIKSCGNQSSSRANKILKYAKNIPNSMRQHGSVKVMPTTCDENVNCNINNSLKNDCYERSSRSLTTSPLFNIRYKSLTNLNYVINNKTSPNTSPMIDFHNTYESSNSGPTSSGSNEAYTRDKKSKFPKLSRSLTNLFWDITAGFLPSNQNLDKIHNELNKRKNNPQQTLYLESYEPENSHHQHHHSKKEQTTCKPVGTLYL